MPVSVARTGSAAGGAAAGGAAALLCLPVSAQLAPVSDVEAAEKAWSLVQLEAGCLL